MLFNSPEFILMFLPVTLVIFFTLGRLRYNRVAIAALVAASLFFYSWWNPLLLLLLIFSIIFNYLLGYGLSKTLQIPVSKKFLLILGITVNLGLLGYFKYANFFISTINDLAGTNFNLTKIILPLGISFFTFQQITYLVDAFQGKITENNWLDYCLFVSFFPKIFAGPIVRYQEMMPQLANPGIYRLNQEDLAVGVTIFIIGLSKKVLIADQIFAYAYPVFSAALQGTPLTFYDAWSGALAYTFQLYFDFCGYSEMAIGTARMFGIKLPLNFDSPYKAVNISDFWRRWHITLSNFLRDYIYIPLGGNRQGEFRRNVNLMTTMLLGGLWHGAGWTFVLWGGLHGAYLIINHQWRSFRKFLGQDLKKSHWWGVALSCLVTFIAVVVGWVFFRAENMGSALAILKTMFGFNGLSLSASVVPERKRLFFLLLLAVWLLPNTKQWLSKYDPFLLEKPVKETNANWSDRIWQRLQWQPNRLLGFLFGILMFISIKIILEAPETKFLYFDF
ncbi:MBOAT family O-acyltransferase [Microseira wollei]|uniref:Alginate O-acetylation protein / membrane bound O-acyl transferase, MBOAT n=1 Tax=Microseira wollei NIES-4236 TaxID=2530354 RepID=A0AAV3X3Q2_9CYAN|nr:MBOAT family protein [Microseira wollei]GET36709.1 alginate O-acetylation protein / membrane bound O-acyl transferase, MBOAT [Microseira wollei NIES-4236]